jgi:hypothetical protein
VELPCTVIEVMEYSANRVFATHYGFGGKYACLRGIAVFPVVTVCCFRHPLVSPLGSQGGGCCQLVRFVFGKKLTG